MRNWPINYPIIQYHEYIKKDWDTPGSERITEVLLYDDPRPVWLQAWRGLTNIAQALYQIKISHPDQWEKTVNKAYIYAFAKQDARKDDDYTKPLWRIMPQSSGFIMLMS